MSKTKGGRSPEAIARHAQRQAEWEASEPARIAAAEKVRRNKMSPSQQRRQSETTNAALQKMPKPRIETITMTESEQILEDGLQRALAVSRANPLVGPPPPMDLLDVPEDRPDRHYQ